MSFDPERFFIGLMDFFSILLPGALLTYLLTGDGGPVVLEDRYAKLAGAEAWAAFLFASYLVGHLVFLLGSWLDEFYDWVRRYTQITLLARRGPMLPWLARALVWLVFKRESNLAMERAGKIKQQALDALQAKDAINTFQPSKAWLNAEGPESLAVVQRFEADSKFFRGFAFVLLLLLAAWPWQHHWSLVGMPVVLVLLLLALWRYFEQRYEATNQAYWSAITLTASAGKVIFGKPVTIPSPTHAGGVVFRVHFGKVEYLLVEAKKDPAQWVLPNGHVEEGEQHGQAAVREVHEETGVWACIGAIPSRPPKRADEEWENAVAGRRLAADLGVVSYTADGAIVTVRFYLMEGLARGLCQDKDRRHAWLRLEEAKKRASHNETRELLQAAEQRRSSTYSSSRSQ